MLDSNQYSSVDLEKEIISEKQLDTLYKRTASPCSYHLFYDLKVCRTNPNCLLEIIDPKKPLGFSSTFTTQIEKKDDHIIREKEIKFMGLQNLGVTCYMNSILQVFFSIPTFRNVIFDWKQKEDEGDIKTEGEKKTDTNSAMNELQLLFANLEKGPQKYFKPIDLATNLELNLSYQQDAEEFYQLLLSFIEERLKEVDKEDAVKTHFVGEQVFETRCEACSLETHKSESFNKIGLNMENLTTFSSMIDQLLREEKVEGYVCEGCKSSDKCVRQLRLKSLPPFLSFQLLRFVYDRTTANKFLGQRKKIFDDIEIPRELNMYPHISGDNVTYSDTKYLIHAVIVHLGSSSHAGHYIAYLFDEDEQCWWRMDDSEVTRISLMNDQNPFQKNRMDFQQTNTPYFVIYRRKDFKVTDIPSKVPAHFEEKIAQVTKKMLEEFKISISLKEEQEKEESKNKEMRETLIDYLKRTYTYSSDTYYWIDTEWLTECLKKFPSPILPPIDNNKLVCPHKNLAYDVSKMKRICKEAWEILHALYQGGPVLTDENMCRDCASEKLEQEKKEKIHSKKRDEIISLAEPMQNYSYRSPYSASYSSYYSNYNSSSSENMVCINKIWYSSWKKGTLTETNFVQDLACHHGKFNVVNDQKELFVKEEVFDYFKQEYMPTDEVPKFFKSGPRCPECVEAESNAKQVSDSIKRERDKEKYECYTPLGRYPQYHPTLSIGKEIAIVSKDWVERWQEYSQGISDQRPGKINEEFICEHGGLNLDINLELHKEKDHRCIHTMSKSEWDGAWTKNYYPGGHKITLKVTNCRPYSFNDRPDPDLEGDSEPAICTECFQKREMLKTESDKIFEVAELKLHQKSRLTNSTFVWEKKIVASYNTTIEQFKLMICQETEIMPYQQELHILDHNNNKLIIENDAVTLYDYGITPYTEFYVRELSEDELIHRVMTMDCDAPTQSSSVEVGFDGSILLKQAQNKVSSPRDKSLKIKRENDEFPLKSQNEEISVLKSEPNTEVPHSDPISIMKEPSNLIEPTYEYHQETKPWPVCKICTFENLDSHYINIKQCEVCGEFN